MQNFRNAGTIAFDADDTLWHNESLFTITQDKFKKLLSPYHSDEWIESRLFDTETRNIQHFGYGVKGFTLSMIETAVELSEGRVSGSEIAEIIGFAKEMLLAPTELLDHVKETIEELSKTRSLMIITKGDLFDQESKIARSGLAEYFEKVEIVKEKDDAVYRNILTKHRIDPNDFVMIGNSLRSDILPVIRLGAAAIHVPYHTTWARELVDDAELAEYSFHRASGMDEVRRMFDDL
jgi:putative hydrolase of the HAD superfamily